jgi:hypothetical protein
MPLLDVFPDVELVICQALMAQFEGLTADTTTAGHDLTVELPFARVQCHGGRDDGVTDTSRLTIDYFDVTRALAKPGAEAVRQFITQRGGFRVGQVVIDGGGTDSKPQDIPWNDSNTPRRFVASYVAAARR